MFPLGLLGGVVLVSLADLSGYLLAMVWGFVAFPHGVAYIRRRSRDAGDDGLDDVETHYWRTGGWQTTR